MAVELEKPTLPGDPSLPTPAEDLAQLYKEDADDHSYQIEDFFRLPERSNYKISPGGKYYAYLGPYQRRNNIFIQKIGQDSAIRITEETDRNIAGYLWVTKTRLVYVKDSGGDENYKMYAVDLDGGNPKDLTPFEKIRIELIDDLPENEEEIIIGMNKNNPALFEPYVINVHTGEFRQLAENNDPMEPISSWITDHDGKLRMATKVVNGIETVLMYRDEEGEPFKEVLKVDFRISIAPLFFDFKDPHCVWLSSNQGRDRTVIVKMDMHTGKEVGAPLFEHPVVDVSDLKYSRRYKKLTAVKYYFEKNHYHFLDPEHEELFSFLEKQFPDEEVIISSTDRAEENFIVRTYSDKTRGSYYHFNKNDKSLNHITDVSPWLNKEDMADMKPIAYESRDGKTIYGYLTVPKGVSENLPVVINPHGGPWHRDHWGFNPEVQLLASRGYAVFQMNFRGSTGFGRDFWESSFKQWGRTMQDDITDGVQWLIKEGIADPARIAIYGGSYGGYATLAGLTFTPDLYSCGIDYVGVSNLFTFFNTIPPYWKPYLEMMYEMVGHPDRDKEALAETSPALQADKIKAPLFVVQGANDPRVNIDESDQIVKSIRSRGIDVPYMVKYDEGHGFANEENSFEMYKAAIGFLKKHLA
ncbi:MAG: S9 family peptidase [Saprospiraceae bacterium]|nr:S9 family peptidase [Saprospiraceae bacterium]